MKKISVLLALIGLMAVIVGCSDDPSNPYAGEKTMTITSADVEFSPLGGTGTVVVNAPNGITGVESAASWATASVSGNTITVNVAENPRVEGRSARLTIKSQSESLYVVIQQNGVDFIFDALPQINADRDGQTFNFLTKSNVPFTVESDVDWITTIVELGSVKVVVAKNETYKERSGNIICKAGGTTKTTTITQAAQISPADKMKGDYYLWYYASSTWNSIDFTLEQIEDENWQIRFTEGEYAEKGIIIPVKVDIEAGKMTIQNLMTIQGDGTYDGQEYQLIGYVLRSNLSANTYGRVNNANFAAIGIFNKDEKGIQYWDFDINDVYDHSAYGYYGFRIAYTTGGYSGQKANLYTWPGMYFEKK